MSETERYDHIVSVNVDIQDDFCPGGSLAVRQGDSVVAPMNSINAWVRRKGGQVVFTRDYHPTRTNHFGNPPDFITTWPVHCVQGTPGAALHEDLDIRPKDLIVSKGTVPDQDAYSGFDGIADDGRSLDAIVFPKDSGSVAIIIGGLATDYCVRATVLDALKRAKQLEAVGKKVGVYALVDAMRAVGPDLGLQAVGEMDAAGAVMVSTVRLMHSGMIGKTRRLPWRRHRPSKQSLDSQLSGNGE